MSITYSECVFVSSIIQHVSRMRPVLFSTVACPALSYFYTLSRKRHDFRLNIAKREMCVLNVCKHCVRNISYC